MAITKGQFRDTGNIGHKTQTNTIKNHKKTNKTRNGYFDQVNQFVMTNINVL